MSVPLVESAMLADIPCLLIGPPGVGKTKGTEAMFQRNNVYYELLIASIRDPQDFAGLPIVDHEKKNYRMAGPSYVARLWEAHKRGQRTALFIDELSTAPPAIQAACLRAIQDRIIGDDPLPPGCYAMGAMNPAEYAANGFELAAPLANRFLHIEYSVNIANFIADFNIYWGNPPKLRGIDGMRWAQKRGQVTTFLHNRGQMLIDLPKEESKRCGAWPSPRTWDYLSRVMAVTDDMGTISTAATGLVGEGAGREFMSFLKDMDLPDPLSVLQGWQTWTPPKRSDKLFAITANVVSYTIDKCRKKDKTPSEAKEAAAVYQQCWKILAKLADNGNADVGGIWAGRVLDAKPDNAPAVTAELVKYSKLLSHVKVS